MEVSQTFSQQTFFPLKSPSQCHYNLNFTHNCLIDCLFVFLSFCPDLSLIIHLSSYSFILIHWNLLSKLNINVASKYSPNRWRSCHRYLLYQLVCNLINVYASNRGAFFVWRAPIMGHVLTSACTLKFLEPSREIRVTEGKKTVLDFP